MENTHQVLFEDNSPQWYIALGDRWVGPLTASDVYQKVVAQEISWAHFVWRAGQANWQRICDTPAFQAAVPRLPAQGVQQEVQEAAKPAARVKAPEPPKAESADASASVPAALEESREWFLYYNNSQFGPFTHEEVSRFLASGRIHPQVHAWRDGMESWDKLEGVGAFFSAVGQYKARKSAKTPTPPAAASVAPATAAVASAPAAPAAKADQRTAPRTPLVAKILMSDDQAVIVGVCRDVSIGGMQVLSDRVPGPVGTRIKLNVSPSGKTERPFDPFVAHGSIVRILEDGRGFSFRFEKLPEAAVRSIESYIASSGA